MKEEDTGLGQHILRITDENGNAGCGFALRACNTSLRQIHK